MYFRGKINLNLQYKIALLHWKKPSKLKEKEENDGYIFVCLDYFHLNNKNKKIIKSEK